MPSSFYPHQTPPVCTQVVDNKIQHTLVQSILKSPLEVWAILSTFTWVFFRCGDLLFRCGKSPFGDFCLACPNHSRMFSYLLSNVSFKWNPLSIKNNLEAFLDNIVLFNAQGPISPFLFTRTHRKRSVQRWICSCFSTTSSGRISNVCFELLEVLKSSTMAQ